MDKVRQPGGRTQHPLLKPSEGMLSVQNSLSLLACPSVAAGYGHYWDLESRGVLVHCCCSTLWTYNNQLLIKYLGREKE